MTMADIYREAMAINATEDLEERKEKARSFLKFSTTWTSRQNSTGPRISWKISTQ